MGRLSNFLNTLKTHPKKSIFFTILASYGGVKVRNNYKDSELLRQYCLRAQKFGDVPHRVAAKHRHVTVILNPSAAKGKCKSKYEKYCAPLLHLAGLKVALVRTEHEGQARQLMSIMENTDCVVVAGGDGTLSEVLTGMMRRSDASHCLRNLPLSVLPLGNSSLSAKGIHGITGSTETEDILAATMSVIEQTVKPVNIVQVEQTVTPVNMVQDDQTAKPVMQVEQTDELENTKQLIELNETVQQDTENPSDETINTSVAEAPKPVYIVSGLEWGAFRDALERQDKYWYWGPLRQYVTHLFSSYKSDMCWSCPCDVEFTDPCSGCSKCRLKDSPPPPPAPVQKKWYHYIIGNPSKLFLQNIQKESKDTTPAIDYSLIDNPGCGLTHHTTIDDASEVRVTSANHPDSKDLPATSLHITATPAVSAFGFIGEGFRRVYSGERGVNSHELTAGKLTITPKNAEDKHFSLDGEEYEVRPMSLRVYPQPLYVFSKSKL